jgi:hypothetical protein
VSNAFYERAFAKISNDCLKERGRFRLILSTLRRIPTAAFWLKKYFCGTSDVSMHGNNVDSTALLGDSEVFTVKHAPCDTVPELVQRLEYDCEVTSSVAREKAVHVFEDNSSWSAFSNEAHEVVKESRLAPSKPRSLPHSRKREVLAGEPSCPYISFRDVCLIERPNVVVEGKAGPMLFQNVSAKGLCFALKNDAKTRALQAQIETANARKERCDGIRQNYLQPEQRRYAGA